jgi:hypothetical protein
MDRNMQSTQRALALVAIAVASFAVWGAPAAPVRAAAPAPARTPLRTLTLTDTSGQKYQTVVTVTTLQKPAATTPEVEQPAVTIYKITPGGRQKIWTAPPSVIPKVQRVSSSPMGWLPLQLIVGPLTPAPLLPEREPQVVFTVHQASADCGTTDVPVIGLGNGSPRVLATVENFCALAFTVSGKTLVLTGPGYKSTDPLCCPSMPKAVARLGYYNGAWKLVPHYFKLVVPPKG